jgi:hypothetical protein
VPGSHSLMARTRTGPIAESGRGLRINESAMLSTIGKEPVDAIPVESRLVEVA